MEKVRVYELAKELNTTSKRLMEKLGEINVVVKNHMSLLEEHELEALYKHIGVIKHDEKRPEPDESKVVPPTTVHPNAEKKKDSKNAPRIIRTTEIIINSKNDAKDVVQSSRNDYSKGDVRGSRSSGRQDFVRSSDANSGLRAGFVRDSRPDYIRDANRVQKQNQNQNQNQNQKKQQDQESMEKAAVKHVLNETKELNEIKEVKEIKESKEVKEVKEANGIPDVKHETPAENTVVVNSEPTKSETEAVKAKDMEKANTEALAAKKEEKADMHDETSNTIAANKVGNETQGTKNVQQQKQEQHSDAGNEVNHTASKESETEDNSQRVKPQNDRPQYQGNRPQGDRPQGDRPQYQGNRPQGDRPQYQGNRPQGDRPQYGSRPQGDRPQYGNRPQGDRPQYQGNRPQGDRPQYQGNRPQGDRPQYGNRPQGDRPPYQGNRPQGDRPQYQGNRPQGDRPQYGNRPQGDRPQYGNRPLDIPKPDLTVAQKEELGSQRSEIRREFSSLDKDKDVKREQRKEAPKAQPVAKGANKRIKPTHIGLSEKKGVSEVLSEDFILNVFYDDDNASKKKRQNRTRRDRDLPQKYIPQRAVLTSIKIPEILTVKDLAESLKKTSADVIKKLMALGMMATLNQEIDFDTATIVAEEYGVKTEKEIVINEEDILFDDTEQDDPDKLVPRPPVVVVMGHVDHGKTSLLDAIRSTHVIESEAGGITQHIGAYMVEINDRNITFLDTPGHEAFTSMRARGAQVTDIAILVVAADDGVMPQTVEAINHAKAANVSIIVAINKIDKPGANPDRVKQELTQHGLVSEEWGGDVICVNVSAKKRENIDHLLEMVLLTADVLELKADPNRQAKGTIIEAKLDKNRGSLATVLVQRGTLNVGDSIVTGTTVGRIRAMVDDKGNTVKSAGPSTPVEILGLPDVPEAGEVFYAIEDEKVAKHLAEKRKFKQKEVQMNTTSRVSLDDLYKQIIEGKVKDLNIIVKADVQGSVEAVKQSLEKLANDEVRVNIVHGGVGAITESDVTLASVSNAIIIGFNVRPGANVSEAAEAAGVDIRLYRVIYNAIEDIQAAMKGMLEPTFKEVVLGHTEVRQIFKVSGIGTIAGGYVTDGKITRNSDVRVIRDGIVLHEGKLASLKRFKDDAKEVLQGYECGLSVERFNDIKENDVIEAFTMEEVKR